MNSSLLLNYQIAKGLSISASIGYNNAQANQENYYLIASQDPLNNPRGTANLGYNSNRNWIAEPQISYERFLGRGKLSILAGGSTQHAYTSGVFITGTGYTSDVLIKSISARQVKKVQTHTENTDMQQCLEE